MPEEELTRKEVLEDTVRDETGPEYEEIRRLEAEADARATRTAFHHYIDCVNKTELSRDAVNRYNNARRRNKKEYK